MATKIISAIFAVFLGVLISLVFEFSTLATIGLCIVLAIIGYICPIFTILSWIVFLFIGSGGNSRSRRG